MTILSHQTLLRRLGELIAAPHAEPALVNPASIDIRIGNSVIVERGPFDNRVNTIDISGYSDFQPYYLPPGEFILAATLERIRVPLDCAVELKLKSSMARDGYNHSLAFWFDPGWDGVGTMEISNVTRFKYLPIWPGMRFAQIIVHMLDEPCAKPYAGRYAGAASVEAAKALDEATSAEPAAAEPAPPPSETEGQARPV